MSDFATKDLPSAPDAIAPDGSHVRMLLGLHSGGLAHFELRPGETSVAVSHRTVEEIWFVLGGRGEMWRKQGDQEQIVPLNPGVTLTIPLGTHFQFRSLNDEALTAIAVTMPPWPGEGEAFEVKGAWMPTVNRRR